MLRGSLAIIRVRIASMTVTQKLTTYRRRTALTVCLHVFILLLTCRFDRENKLAFSASEARAALEDGLENMRPLEETSLMTYKARHCLIKLLRAFDLFGESLLWYI